MFIQNIANQTKTIFEGLKTCLDKRHTFAIYKLPAKRDITLVYQNDSRLHEITNINKLLDQKGFLVAPFSGKRENKTFVIRPDIVATNLLTQKQYQQILSTSGTGPGEYGDNHQVEVSKEEYMQQVDTTIKEINDGAYDKVVLSRIKRIKGNYQEHLDIIFKLLCESYPNAFVYLFNIKGHCWVGATPEPLIYSNEQFLHTVSLAGTRPYSEENMEIANWNNKERREQEYVTENIDSILEKYKIRNYIKIGPYTKKAGQLIHLRTDYSFSSESAGKRLPALINSLHPTSAVCGMPMETSHDFILDIEKHNREYYAGYLGPIGLDDKLQFFVNLRCMKVLDKELNLFIGGGITNDSIANEEWHETEIKADILLSIIQQI